MTVRQLIVALKKCDPGAQVEVEGYNCRADLQRVHETFYNYRNNKWVILVSEASEKPESLVKAENNLAKAKKLLADALDHLTW